MPTRVHTVHSWKNTLARIMVWEERLSPVARERSPPPKANTVRPRKENITGSSLTFFHSTSISKTDQNKYVSESANY